MVRARKYRDNERAQEIRIVCRVCLGDHPLRFCNQFLDLNLEERLHLVVLCKHCSGCLGHDHNWRTCESKGKCKHCGDAHHSLLCDRAEEKRLANRGGPRPSQDTVSRRPRSSQEHRQSGPSSSRSKPKGGPRSSQNLRSAAHSTALVKRGPRPSQSSPQRRCCALVRGKDVSRSKAVVVRSEEMIGRRGSSPRPMEIELLPVGDSILLRPTAVIKVIGSDRYHYVRALMDPNLSYSIVSEDAVRRLGLETFRVGDIKKCVLHLKGRYGNATTIRTLPVVKRSHVVITPARSLDKRVLDDFPGYQLSDSHFYESGPVEVTLGGDVYYSCMRKGMTGGIGGRPVATFSIFGYLISGVCSM